MYSARFNRHLRSSLRQIARLAWLIGFTASFFSPNPVYASPKKVSHPGPTASPDATTIFVDQDAAGLDNGTSWTNAYTDLQDALTHSNSGDQIWVAEGVYTPTLQTDGGDPRSASFSLVEGVEIFGGFNGDELILGERDIAAHETILSGDLSGNDSGFNNNTENSYHVVIISGVSNNTILDGFTIRGGNASGAANPFERGGGFYGVSGNPRLRNLTVATNSAVMWGGGMYNSAGNPTLFNVTFTNNKSYGDGGGLYNTGGAPSLASVAFFGNTAVTNGGGIFSEGSGPQMINCLFSGNSAAKGGGIYNISNSNISLINATLSANNAPRGGGIYNNGGTAQIKNSLIWENLSEQILNDLGSFNVYRSIIKDGCPYKVNCTSTTASDPLFIDSNGPDDAYGTPDDNLYLQFDSPGIDAGDNSLVPSDTLDLDGDGNTTEKIPYDLRVHPRFSDILFIPDQGVGTAPLVDLGAIEARIIYVKTGGIGENNGTSWANAFHSLASAINDATAGEELWVAQGEYKPSERRDPADSRSMVFKIKDGIALYGGFTGNEVSRSQRDARSLQTILSGDLLGNDQGFTHNDENSYHVVIMDSVHSGTILNGFVIRGGNANDQTACPECLIRKMETQGGVFLTFKESPDTPVPPNDSGGGMYLNKSSPTLVNLTFIDNYAIQGGGLYNRQGSPLMINCAWYKNQASFGGGIENYTGEAQLVNSLFDGNLADARGAGVFNLSSSPSLINVTFAQNVAAADSDAFYNGTATGSPTGHPVLINTILWNNGSSPIILESGSNATIHHSLSQTGCPANATCSSLLTADPRFVDADGADNLSGSPDDDLHLKPGSPARDYGDNNSVPADSTDINENGNTTEKLPLDLAYEPRFQGIKTPLIVDLGAYENDPAAVFLPIVLR